MELKFQVHAKISKPREEVFDAVANPDKLSKYFTTGGASGPLLAGTEVIWKFADYPGDIPVYVKKAVPNEVIVFQWKAEDPESDYMTTVELAFESVTPRVTLVRATESGWRETERGLKSSYMNCEGWMNMLCCLKAWLEHNINLREGFF
jgi:uncharacterized protein YndB with AHSA1/START domain